MAKTNYQELTQYNSPNYTPNSQVRAIYGMNRDIIGIVYHWWGDPNLNPLFLNIIAWLCRQNGNSSAHVVGEALRIAWIIDAIHAAWHAGNARGNALYVGYECNPRLSDGDYQTMGEFHYDMEKAYGRTLEIRVHKEFSTTQCSPIDKARIRRIADALHAQDRAPQPPASQPVPAAVKLPKPIEFKARFNNAQVWDLTTNPNYKGVKSLKAGEDFLAYAKILFNNATYYVTEYSFGKGIKSGVNSVDLTPVAEVVPDPEWIRNMKDYNGAKLSVLPADGVKVVNLNTFAPVNDTIIPRGTQVDIVKETTIGGKKYYLSSYAMTNSLPWGIFADLLGVPVVEPPKEKPEWLKNLKDIADQDFWARSEAPVLSITDGSTARKLQLNDKVRITHATEILGKPYLVLQFSGDQPIEVIETVYLSDKEIINPMDDIEKRLTALEAFKKLVMDFLSAVFKNFNK